MKALHFTVCVTAVLCLAGAPASAAKYSGGDGHHNPWQIANLDDWNELVSTPGDWGNHFVLTSNLDLDGIVYEAAPIAPDTDNSYAEHQGPKFTGSLNGQGHILYNLTINAPDVDFVGLIGFTDARAAIKNLTLNSVVLMGRNRVGSLVGQASGWELRIENCFVSGTVQGNDHVGGLAGFHFSGGSMTNCAADVAVQGNDEVGGLIGNNHWGMLSDCQARGNVGGNNVVGGLAGRNSSSEITRCFATGQVSGTVEVGGLVGANGGPIHESYAAGKVEGRDRVAGLTGSNLGTISRSFATGKVLATHVAVGGLVGFNDGPVDNTYAIGNVTAHERVGGLAGVNINTISNSYSSGMVTAEGPYVGGLVGDNGYGIGSAIDSFWDTQTSGRQSSAGGTGQSTEEMKQPDLFMASGWDFSMLWGIGLHQTYPYILKRLKSELNEDGAVDLKDLAIFSTQWLSSF